MSGHRWLTRLGVLAVAGVLGCGGGGADDAPGAGKQAPAGEGDLTAFEMEHGVGPVKEVVKLGAADPKVAEQGKAVFTAKCTACHKMGEKYVGPALGEVLTVRTPAYVMNMILNPQEMVERHPVAKQLLAEHMTFMANQAVTVEDARAIVEYLRTQAQGTVKTQ
jgi:cytochrome c